MRIIDTHLHLLYPDRLSYPWLPDVPAVNRPWPHDGFFAEAAPLGIDSALHMEVDVAEADMLAETAFMLTLPRIAGAIAACRPEHDDFPLQLDQLLALGPKVKGVRRILHELPDSLSQTPLFAENLRRLAAHGLSFELTLRADQLHLGRTLAKAAPDVQFILCHCGNPDIAAGALDPWRANVSALAALPNVAGKISGIVNRAGPDWTAETLRPYVEHMVAAFGWDRIVWGSDYPMVTRGGTLTRWVSACRSIFAAASAEEQSRVFHANAERIYRL